MQQLYPPFLPPPPDLSYFVIFSIFPHQIVTLKHLLFLFALSGIPVGKPPSLSPDPLTTNLMVL